MMLSLVLIEGQNVSEETLRSVSLGNAKQLVVGNALGIWHDVRAQGLPPGSSVIPDRIITSIAELMA
jgi:hypothetical protein